MCHQDQGKEAQMRDSIVLKYFIYKRQSKKATGPKQTRDMQYGNRRWENDGGLTPEHVTRALKYNT